MSILCTERLKLLTASVGIKPSLGLLAPQYPHGTPPSLCLLNSPPLGVLSCFRHSDHKGSLARGGNMPGLLPPEVFALALSSAHMASSRYVLHVTSMQSTRTTLLRLDPTFLPALEFPYPFPFVLFVIFITT